MYIESSNNGLRTLIKDANECFEWLVSNKDMLTAEQQYLLNELSANPKDWALPAFNWLKSKRSQYDPIYRQIKAKEADLAAIRKKVVDIEHKAAMEKFKRQEEAIEICRLTGLPEETEEEMEIIWDYLRTNPRMRRRLYEDETYGS